MAEQYIGYIYHDPERGWEWRVWLEEIDEGGGVHRDDDFASGYSVTRWGAKRAVRRAIKKAERHKDYEPIEIVVPKDAT